MTTHVLHADDTSARQWIARGVKGGLLTALPVLILGIVIAAVAPNYYQSLATAAVINLIIVVGLQVFMGNSGLPNLGHSAFVGLGAYGMAVLATPIALKKLSIPNAPLGLSDITLNPAVATVITLMVVAVLAVISGRIISRLAGIAATIVSLAFLVIVHSTFLHWPALFKGNQGFFGIPQWASLPVVLGGRCWRSSWRACSAKARAACSYALPPTIFRQPRRWRWIPGRCGAAPGCCRP